MVQLSGALPESPLALPSFPQGTEDDLESEPGAIEVYGSLDFFDDEVGVSVAVIVVSFIDCPQS